MQPENLTPVVAPEKLPEAKKGKRYGVLELSMIRGWTSTEDILALQQICCEFQENKNTDTHRDSVMKAMMQWATMLRLEIYQGIYM